MNVSFFGELLQTISERSRALLARNRRVEASVRSESLVELCEHLLSGRGDYPWVQSPLGSGRLQPVPVGPPALTAPGTASNAATVGEGRRPAELDVGLAGPGKRGLIALLDRGEHGQDHVG